MALYDDEFEHKSGRSEGIDELFYALVFMALLTATVGTGVMMIING